MVIGLKIKKYLDDNGIKYSYVANKIGMPMNIFSPKINGKKKLTAEEFLCICDTLGIDPGSFSERSEQTTKN